MTEAEELELLELENENATVEPDAPRLNERHSVTATASVEPPATLAYSLVPGPDPEHMAQLGRGFLGQPSRSAGPGDSIAYEVGRSGLQSALSMGGQAAGALVGGAAGTAAAPGAGTAAGALGGGAIGAGIGAGIGTAIQSGARAFAAARQTPGVTAPTIGRAISDVASSAAINAATAFAVPKAIEAAPKAFDYLATSKLAGGIAKPAWEYFKANTKAVLEKIGSGAEVADDLANDLRTSISNATQKLEDVYRAGVQKLSEGKAGRFRLNVQDGVYTPLRAVAEDFGFLDPNRNAGTPEATFFVQRVLGRLDKLKQASPLDVYHFQKDLNGWINDNIGANFTPTTLGRSLLDAKMALRAYIESTPRLKPIADMNAAWHESELITAAARKFTNKDDLVGYLRRVFSNPQETLAKRNFERVSALVPEVGQKASDLQAYQSARAVTPLLRSATGTGLETAGGIGIAAMLSPKALAVSPFLSPRAYALGYAYGPDAAALARSTGVRSAAAIGANTLLDYYRGAQSPAR